MFKISAILIAILFQNCKSKTPLPIFDAKSTIDETFNTNWSNLPTFHNGQNGFSILLSNGSILWLFSNANINNLTNAKVPCTPNVHNAAVVQLQNNYALLNTGNTDFIPQDVNNNYYTPTCGYCYEDSLFIYCTKPNAPNKNVLYIAKIYKPTLKFLKMDSINIPSSIAYTDNYQFGLSIASDTVEGYTYNYGRKISNSVNGNIIVARHSLDNPHKPWTYYNGNNAWVVDINKAAPVITNATDYFSVQSLKKQFVYLSKESSKVCGQGVDIYSAISNKAIGPFNSQRKLFTIPDKFNNYNPQSANIYLHNALISSNNLITITYALNGYSTCTSDCDNNYTDPSHYNCKAFKVPLNSIYNQW